MYRGLRADEIEVRVGNVKEKGVTFLLYKDARCDQNILDEVHGSENWQRDHKEIKGNLFGGVGIWNGKLNQWVWKWDCGTESNTEKEKGEASDSFKRSCFNLGIGRELYTAGEILIPFETESAGEKRWKMKKPYLAYGLRVAEITYQETESKREIKTVVIVDKFGKVVFDNSGVGEKKITPAHIKEIRDWIARIGRDEDSFLSWLEVDVIGDITYKEYQHKIKPIMIDKPKVDYVDDGGKDE